MANLQTSFHTLLDAVFIRHNGCIIEKAGSTYIWNRKCYPTLTAAKAAIDSVRHIISNSLKPVA